MDRVITLHPYQRRAVKATIEAWEQHRSALIVMPTGCGKTITFAAILAQRLQHGRSVMLAHREELIHQAAQKIRWVTGVHCDIEMADFRADQTMEMWHSPIIVSSIQTQIAGNNGNGRMARFDPMRFATAVVDEAHHVTASSYGKVLAHYKQNPALKILGVTATPNRHDEAALGQVFEHCAFQYDLIDAIDDGWLVPVRSFTMPIESLNISGVKTTAGDLNGAGLAREMEKEKPLLGYCNAIWHESKGRKTLVFAASVEHARLMCGIFNTDYESGIARFVSGKTPKEERRQILRDYANGVFRILCNCAVLGEGFDDPSIEVVVPRPTKSTPAYMQMIGRATRILPGVIDTRNWDDDQKELGIEGEIECAALRRRLINESNKPHCEILDLHCQEGRHKLIKAQDVLGGSYPDDVIELANKMAREDGQADAPQARLKRAAEQIQHAAEQRLARQAINAEARYRKFETDPFKRFGVIPPRESGFSSKEMASEKQQNMLRGYGVKNPETLTKRQASAIIDKLLSNQANLPVSHKQAWHLKKFGFNPGMSRALAKPIMDLIFKEPYGRKPEHNYWDYNGNPKGST